MRRLRGRPLVQISLDEVEAAIGGAPDVVLEAGCHTGIDTAAMARAWPDATIHATEPMEEARHAARLACAELANVTIGDFALSDEPGEATMRVSSRPGSPIGSASSSLLDVGAHEATFPDVRFDATAPVRCRTLDDWFAEVDAAGVDLLWLDVQGMEIRVLAAAVSTLAVTRAVHLEVARRELFDGSGTIHEVHAFMTSQGFGRAIDRVGPIFGNALYVRT